MPQKKYRIIEGNRILSEITMLKVPAMSVRKIVLVAAVWSILSLARM
ncbi:MAG TPA: hypothetical protein PK307_03995 [Spirochaetota bacterium]|nr:hypothetical protein [Spirochaetota bacterium]HPG52167.1 hypothetical protein [Spirochaetota bacterium]HPN12180.1 hypothetical protein [Spirochaetota bacterium]HQL81336.1 hypothetical protein [Spirochaetota bacterium]